MVFDPKQYILSERAKGTPDDKIYDSLNAQGVFKPKQVERGLGGEIIPTVGAIGGGILGAPLGPVSVAGGSALGGALGETAQQALEKGFGVREEFDKGQIAASGIISGVLPVAQQAVVAGAKPIIKAAQPSIIKILKWTSGYADDVLTKALERTPGAVSAIKGGERVLNDIVKRSAVKISKLASDTLLQSQKAVSKLDKTFSLGGVGKEGSRNLVLQEGRKFINNVINTFRTSHNIGVAEKTLYFARTHKPSRIVSGGDQKTIQEAYNWLLSIQKDTSIKHLDSVLERLIVLKNKTPIGSPTGTQTKAIINEIIGEFQKFASQTYPEYGKFLSENLPKRVLIKEAQQLFGATAKPSPAEVSKITGRLLQLYNTGRLAAREGFETTQKEIGEDITGAVAGTVMKLDESVSFRAKSLGARKLYEKIIEFVPRKLLDNYVATGKYTGELLENSAIKTTAKTLGITTKAVIQELVNLVANKERL